MSGKQRGGGGGVGEERGDTLGDIFKFQVDAQS